MGARAQSWRGVTGQPSHRGAGGASQQLSRRCMGQRVQGAAWGMTQHRGTHLPHQRGVHKVEPLLGWGGELVAPMVGGDCH